MQGSEAQPPDTEKIVIFQQNMPEFRFLQTMAHIVIPLHQSKLATILHIATACLADDYNCACMNSMMHSE